MNIKMNEKQERNALESKWVQVVKHGEEMRKNIEVVKENIEEILASGLKRRET